MGPQRKGTLAARSYSTRPHAHVCAYKQELAPPAKSVEPHPKASTNIARIMTIRTASEPTPGIPESRPSALSLTSVARHAPGLTAKLHKSGAQGKSTAHCGNQVVASTGSSLTRKKYNRQSQETDDPRAARCTASWRASATRMAGKSVQHVLHARSPSDNPTTSAALTTLRQPPPPSLNYHTTLTVPIC